MDFEQFEKSLAAPRAPAELGPSLRALWLVARDEEEQAHELVMDEEDPDAAWVHAHLHRREGRLDDADYWYRRAGRERPRGTFAAEWAAIVRTLLGPR